MWATKKTLWAWLLIGTMATTVNADNVNGANDQPTSNPASAEPAPPAASRRQLPAAGPRGQSFAGSKPQAGRPASTPGRVASPSDSATPPAQMIPTPSASTVAGKPSAGKAAATAATLQRHEVSNEEKEILVTQALDELTTLRIQEKPIGEAIQILSDNTGIPIEFDRFVLGCLPYGTKTMISATIPNQPLRTSLTALLNPLACQFKQTQAKLVISPRPALFRIGRRAAWEEVTLIERLYAKPWSKELSNSLKFQFQGMSAAEATAARQKIDTLADSIGAGSAANVLDLACDQNGWAWHPEKDILVICTKTRQVEMQLQRLISVQYTNMQLKDVLLDLAQQSGMVLKMEPGVLAMLPAQQTERYRLMLENVTVRQAFEVISGETGLGYAIEGDGIRITLSSTATTQASGNNGPIATKSTNPAVGTVPVPGIPGATWFIREQDLSPSVNQARIEYIQQVGKQLQAALSSTNPSSTANPSANVTANATDAAAEPTITTP